jgi:ankyrin repeat protein
MDPKFRTAEAAINAGDLARVSELLSREPELATARSTCSHPTLLQCVVLVKPAPDGLEQLIRVLAAQGAELTGPLIAAACIDNVRAINELLDLGASTEGNGRWSPLEEALYWGYATSAKQLLERGAVVDNLRKAAALGRMDVLLRCFDDTGALTAAAGKIASPFDKLDARLADAVRNDRREIVNNALVYAAAWGQHAAMQELLNRGAEINAIPAGFDFAGTPLHYAALQGRRETVDWLLQHGADPAIRDAKINNLPEDWAAHDGHTELAEYLKQARQLNEQP